MGLKLGGVADAYLEWAFEAGFDGFAQSGGSLSSGGNRMPLRLTFLVKWHDNKASADHLKGPSFPGDLGIRYFMSPVYTDEAYATFFVEGKPNTTLDASTLDPLIRWLRTHAERVELATALNDFDPNFGSGLHDKQLTELGGGETVAQQWSPQGDLVVACIDDAFPFAHPHLLPASDGGHRVLRLWDQGRNDYRSSRWLPLPEKTAPSTPPQPELGYGAELINWSFVRRASTSSENKVGATGWLQKLKDLFGYKQGFLATVARKRSGELPTPTVLADDVAYYQSMGAIRLAERVTHGAHVLDVLCGPVPVRNRISADRDAVNMQGGHCGKAPTWARAEDEAAKAPLVLVQLPDAAINDPSGRWLGANVLDALHYIAWAAGNAKRVVVNVSWGPQTGPHDGSSLLEKAMDAMVTAARDNGRELTIVVPVGNSFQSRAHAEIDLKAPKSLTWVVPPGAEKAAFLEIWWPAEMARTSVTVTAPDGSRLTLSPENRLVTHSHGAVSKRWGLVGNDTGFQSMVLLALQPTFSHSPASPRGGSTAPHGRWTIDVGASSNAAGVVHVYVARADQNMGGRRRARASYLLDAEYETIRRRIDGRYAPDSPSALVKRAGTINGIATGENVFVAGGYRLADTHTAWYSSSGLSRGPRLGPNYLYPTDESLVMRGVLGGGVRPGTVVRLSGTSAAAPQMAREIINRGLPAVGNWQPGAVSRGVKATSPNPRRGLGKR